MAATSQSCVSIVTHRWRVCKARNVLTIAKLRAGPGSVDYYLGSVANGIEDYYAGKGEAPGEWLGPAADRLGLEGAIDDDTLRSVLAGTLPGASTSNRSPTGNRTPGWDLTWSAPKSVSVLYGLTDDNTSREVVAAHDAAVGEAMKYLDRWAVVSRRRIDGEVTPVEGRGMIAATFRHRTSRNMDPQLHTHALVPNAVERSDGTWGAIDSRVFYRHAKTAGFVYQAVLRSEMTNRLGVAWGAVTNGFAEVQAVPAQVNDMFSTRRKEIEAELDAKGASSIKASRTAALRTRSVKQEAAGTDVLRSSWRERVVDADLDVDAIGKSLHSVDEALNTVSRKQRRLVNEHLVGEHGLTESKTSFNRGDIVRAWCEKIDTRTATVDADLIDDLVASTTLDKNSVVLGNGDPLHGVADRRRWSTAGLMILENTIVDDVAAGRNAGIAQIDARSIDRVLEAHPTIGDEQAQMVASITGDGHRIDAVVGVAGSGKTFALGVANELWTEAGYTPIGLAFAGKAARGLESGSGIESSTIDKFLKRIEMCGDTGLPDNAVVVIDEAGMVPTRKLSTLLSHMQPDTKVVLVGDHHQLPEIGAGGVLRGIVERLDDVPMLTENRRQRDVDERSALAEIRDGDVGAGLDWYVEAGRVTSCEDMDDARTQLVDAWWNDHAAQRTDQLMMAERRVDVARLNDLARERFTADGRLSDERLDANDRDYAVGDRVMFVSNDYDIEVRNGERATITALDTKNGTLTVDVDDRDESVIVPLEYLEAGGLEWGYAATVHKNQGATSDYSYLIASDMLYRELGYTALSRGRVENRIWTVADMEHDAEHEEAHSAEPETPRDPIAELVRAMERSAAQQLAIDEAPTLDPHHTGHVDVDVDALIDRRDAVGNMLYRSAPLRVHDELDDAQRRLAVAERRLGEAADHEWIARSDGVEEARAQLDQYAAMQARFDDWTRDHQDDLVERRQLDTQIEAVLTARVVATEHDPPEALVEQIGHPPVGVDARNDWRAAAVAIAIDERRQERDGPIDDRPTVRDDEMELT